jgi:outer membrane protein assembly factor BamD
MVLRTVVLAILVLTLSGWRMVQAQTSPVVQIEDNNEKAVLDAEAARQMNAARFFKEKGNNPQAINRFRVVILEYQISPYVEEALAHISDAYLALGMKPEAQCAVAVLQQKFPDSPWSQKAADALKSAGLQPAEDQKSWMYQAFNGTRL